MKNLIIILMAFISYNGVSQDNSVKWETEFTKARALSKTQNKPILMCFTDHKITQDSDLLNAEFFNTNSFEKLSKGMIFFQVNVADRSVDNQRLNIHYNKVNTFPNLVLLDANGIIIGQPLNTISKESIDSFFNVLQSKTK